MKDFRRMFVVKDGNCGGWTDSTRTSFIIAVEGDELSVKVCRERPTEEADEDQSV